MYSFALARAEMKRALTDRKVRLATLVITLVPLLYGALYLWAFWDPYARLDHLPVALINEDRPATTDDGERIFAGKDIADELLDRRTFEWHVVSSEEARRGLEDGRYYLALTIPQDFSASLASADSTRPTPAQLQVHAHESANLLAAQIGDRVFQEVRAAASASAARKYVDAMLLGFSDAHGKIESAALGARDLAEGLTDAKRGAQKLASGAHDASVGAASLSSGLGELDAGTQRLRAGTSNLASGLERLAAGTRQASAGAASVRDGSTAVAEGVDLAAHKLQDAAAGAGQLKQAASGTLAALQAYLASHPEAGSDPAFSQAFGAAQATAAGVASLADGLSQATGDMNALAAGAEQLRAGATDLATGVAALDEAAAQAADGARSLDDGAAALESGASQAHAGATQLSAGLRKLDGGTHALATGLAPAVSGSAELADGLTAGAEALPVLDEDARATKADVMSDPVRLTTKRIDPVPNYGTGFSPYFIPLVLWVGALMAFFVAHPLPARAIEERRPPLEAALSGYWPAALIGIAQTVVMLAVLQIALGLKPTNALALYAFTVLSALTFLAILQWLSAAFGPVGKFLSIVLLMLQLTSSAGTFPLETVPPFFQAINPYLPMTYVVAGLREAISGGDMARLASDARILVAFLFGALALSTITAWRARTWSPERLRPALEL
ncbi:MAG: YhgE/Pip domain-containing protein [Anaerosomatales bacterium]|nr:YhgE/Pip domain-containing protein [Anaerosomatales bacterium]